MAKPYGLDQFREGKSIVEALRSAWSSICEIIETSYDIEDIEHDIAIMFSTKIDTIEEVYHLPKYLYYEEDKK